MPITVSFPADRRTLATLLFQLAALPLRFGGTRMTFSFYLGMRPEKSF